MSSRAGYLQHMRSHSNQAAGDGKPYKCDECSASYTQVGVNRLKQPLITTFHSNHTQQIVPTATRPQGTANHVNVMNVQPAIHR